MPTISHVVSIATAGTVACFGWSLGFWGEGTEESEVWLVLASGDSSKSWEGVGEKFWGNRITSVS